MNKTNNSSLTGFAQKLRREMTQEERRLWFTYLKKLPVTVNRQKVIGNYIADFYCAGAGVVIEVDGSQHYEDEGVRKDRERDAYFRSRGLTVLRYSNADVNKRFKAVCEDIWNHIGTPHPSPAATPSPQGEGKALQE